MSRQHWGISKLLTAVASAAAVAGFLLVVYNLQQDELRVITRALTDISYLAEQQQHTNSKLDDVAAKLEQLIRIDERTHSLETRVDCLEKKTGDVEKKVARIEALVEGVPSTKH